MSHNNFEEHNIFFVFPSLLLLASRKILAVLFCLACEQAPSSSLLLHRPESLFTGYSVLSNSNGDMPVPVKTKLINFPILLTKF